MHIAIPETGSLHVYKSVARMSGATSGKSEAPAPDIAPLIRATAPSQ